MKVTFLVPSVGRRGTFYEIFTDLVQVAARQLDIDLEVVDAVKQRETMLAHGRAIAKRSQRPDYVLLVNYLGVGRDLLAQYAAAGIGTFFVVEALSDADLGTSSRRTGFLGQIIPDDTEAGRILAEILRGAARARGLVDNAGRVQMGAIAGEHTPSGNARFRGWQILAKQQADVMQVGFQYGAWEEKPARAAAALMLRTAPQIGVLWCASDAMALGALSAAATAGRHPGKDILIGGIDLLERALVEVAAGRLEVTIGGHIIDGVRALLLLYDHHQQYELKPERRTTHFVAVRAPQADRYLRFMKERAWHNVDFKRFSRVKNPNTTELSLEAIMSG
jgi:ABC-type sugar transport system substrate-binding protein